MKNTFGERVRSLRESLGMSQSELAKLARVSQSTVNDIETGRNKGSRSMLELATALRCNPVWLKTGVGSPDLNQRSDPSPQTIAAPDFSQVPLVSLVQAGAWSQIANSFEPGDGYDFLDIDKTLAANIGVSSFALEIAGDSMLPDFKPGDKVIVDPSITPSPGDIVVAKLDGDECATIKKYRELTPSDDGTPVIELVPLNPDFAPLVMNSRTPGHIVGVVVEHRRALRRYF